MTAITILAMPLKMAHKAMMYTSASAVRPGQNRARRPNRMPITPSVNNSGLRIPCPEDLNAAMTAKMPSSRA